MKNTRASVTKEAVQLGLHAIQIDGIPEGFAFLREGKTIGGKDTGEQYVVYVPMTDTIVELDSLRPLDELLKLYDKARHGK